MSAEYSSLTAVFRNVHKLSIDVERLLDLEPIFGDSAAAHFIRNFSAGILKLSAEAQKVEGTIAIEGDPAFASKVSHGCLATVTITIETQERSTDARR